jgi:hypothetical protein
LLVLKVTLKETGDEGKNIDDLDMREYFLWLHQEQFYYQAKIGI